MTDFFDDTHVTQAGLQGSLGPSVSVWDMVQQGFRQQYHVDSAMGLQAELGNRWAESISALRASGQSFDTPTDPRAYLRFAEFTRGGAPVTAADDNPQDARFGTPHLSTEFEDMRRANEAIRQLNNPQIKTFEQILAEVSQMQHGVEEQTASMSERTGAMGAVAGMLGAMAGSFTFRDPLNLVTAPIGFGRTIAMRIATDMAVNAGVTAVTDIAEVNPNRAFVGLPERNPAYDIAASALGAGLIRGGIEGLGAGVRSLHARAGGDINFDFRDEQLHQMFAANDHSPSARAASSILDDTIIFEHSNPYGDGHVAGYRWQAELEGTARALNGEPEARLDLPPIPSDQIERSLSFQSVKETAPELWNELEVARTRLNKLDDITTVPVAEPDYHAIWNSIRSGTLNAETVATAGITDVPHFDMTVMPAYLKGEINSAKDLQSFIESHTQDGGTRGSVVDATAVRKSANKQYREAYQKVEQEAVRLEHAEVAKRSIAQTQAIDVLGPAMTAEPMTGPLTRFDFVEAHAGKVDAADAAIPSEADAVNDLKVDPETNTVDIGTKTPVSADFKVPFEDGELSVKEVLDDLAEDQRLEEAMKGCSI